MDEDALTTPPDDSGQSNTSVTQAFEVTAVDNERTNTREAASLDFMGRPPFVACLQSKQESSLRLKQCAVCGNGVLMRNNTEDVAVCRDERRTPEGGRRPGNAQKHVLFLGISARGESARTAILAPLPAAGRSPLSHVER